jgi:hypothetical protein
LYGPDYRNLRHQRYCSQPACHRVSQIKSQRRWVRSAKGRSYFRRPKHVQRVKAWRVDHPGYWRTQRQKPVALQDVFFTQAPAIQGDKPVLNETERKNSAALSSDLSSEQSVFDPRKPLALQDLFSTQLALQLGLIEQLTGALQDDIAPFLQRLILRGRQIQGRWTGGVNIYAGVQTSLVPGTPAQGAGAVQLDRSAPGSG